MFSIPSHRRDPKSKTLRCFSSHCHDAPLARLRQMVVQKGWETSTLMFWKSRHNSAKACNFWPQIKLDLILLLLHLSSTFCGEALPVLVTMLFKSPAKTGMGIWPKSWNLKCRSHHLCYLPPSERSYRETLCVKSDGISQGGVILNSIHQKVLLFCDLFYFILIF